MNLIGDLIREKRKRKGWSQTVLGDFVGMSTATIHRIEYGEKIPTDTELILFANALSLELQILYDACAEARKIRPTRKLPAFAYKIDWQFAHPSTYSGQVWIQVTPLSENRDKPHHYSIRWGKWAYEGQLQFDKYDSLYLLHYKHNDGEGLPIVFHISEPSYAVFGKETYPEDALIDITLGWKRVEPYSLTQMWRLTLSHFLLNLKLRVIGKNNKLT